MEIVNLYKALKSSFDYHQCSQIWQFVTNLATFHAKLLLKFWFDCLTILANFWLILQIWLKTDFKPVYIFDF